MKNLFIKLKRRFLYITGKKFIFSVPKNIDVLILDQLSGKRLTHLLDNKHSFYILRPDDEIYIKCLFKSLFTNNFIKFPILNKISLNYYICIIEEISPKLVLTAIDNSPLYWNIDFLISEKTKFLTIQNGTKLLKDLNNKNIPIDYQNRFLDYPPFYSNLACLSQFDYDHFTKFGGTINHFHIVGSYSISSYISSFKKENLFYDICLVANGKNGRMGEMTMIDYVLRFTKNNAVKVCVVLKGDASFEENLLRFSELLKCSNVTLIERDGYSSHNASDASKITIGHGTTLLRQTFSRGNKIYPLNFIDDSLSPPFDVLGLNMSPEYGEFEKELKNLLSIDYKSFINTNQKKMEYLDKFDVNNPPDDLLRKLIKDLLK